MQESVLQPLRFTTSIVNQSLSHDPVYFCIQDATKRQCGKRGGQSWLATHQKLNTIQDLFAKS